jgi:hypothetical protein
VRLEEELPVAVRDLEALGNLFDPSLGDLTLDRALGPSARPRAATADLTAPPAEGGLRAYPQSDAEAGSLLAIPQTISSRSTTRRCVTIDVP